MNQEDFILLTNRLYTVYEKLARDETKRTARQKRKVLKRVAKAMIDELLKNEGTK